eukprot:UN21906
MISRECLKKVLLCHLLRFPTIQFVHSKYMTQPVVKFTTMHDSSFIITTISVCIRTISSLFFIFAHLHINKK